MKRYLSLIALLLAVSATVLSAQEKEHRFEIAGGSYYSTGLFASPVIGAVSVGYKVNNTVGVNINGLASNLYGARLSWGATAGVSAYPKITERFFVIPSLELGVLGGTLNGQDYAARFAAALGAEARFMVYDNFWCGFDAKMISAGKGMETFLFGIKLAIRL